LFYKITGYAPCFGREILPSTELDPNICALLRIEPLYIEFFFTLKKELGGECRTYKYGIKYTLAVRGPVFVSDLKVLIVDDQSGIRRLLTEYFRHEGWQPVEATNGREALDKLPENPDVILLDMKMPVMDGIDCLEKLRQTHPNLPVIVMTAYGEQGIMKQAEELGIDGKVFKPFDVLALRDAVLQVHDHQRLPVVS
jgi:two-component system response regulator (stage 0 sporulation protein F)